MKIFLQMCFRHTLHLSQALATKSVPAAAIITITAAGTAEASHSVIWSRLTWQELPYVSFT